MLTMLAISFQSMVRIEYFSVASGFRKKLPTTARYAQLLREVAIPSPMAPMFSTAAKKRSNPAFTTSMSPVAT